MVIPEKLLALLRGQLRTLWTNASASEREELERELIERLYRTAYHAATVDAVELCEYERRKHLETRDRHAATRDFGCAAESDARMKSAERCSLLIKELLSKKLGA
jgi:hypothetical protein